MSPREQAAESRSFCLVKSEFSIDPTHRLIQIRVLSHRSENGLKNTE